MASSERSTGRRSRGTASGASHPPVESKCVAYDFEKISSQSKGAVNSHVVAPLKRVANRGSMTWEFGHPLSQDTACSWLQQLHKLRLQTLLIYIQKKHPRPWQEEDDVVVARDVHCRLQHHPQLEDAILLRRPRMLEALIKSKD